MPNRGNVPEDTGLPDAEQRLTRGHLAVAIRNAIRNQGLTQAEAAERMGMQQLDVVRILHGRLFGFTFERLQQALESLTRSSS